jgi:tRNA G18 (ribose-2'-O)-methylase SpoU
MIPLLAADDDRLSDYRNLSDAELLQRSGAFVAEGRLVVRRLLASSRFRTRSVMVTEPALASIADLDLPSSLPVYVVPQVVMNQVSGFNIHRGCLAIGERCPDEPWRTLAATARRLVVLERVGNADNVGAIFRNAAAFGVDAVLLGPSCVDPLYRKAIRTSMGASLTVAFAPASPWPEALETLGTLGFQRIALTPGGRAAGLDAVARAAAGERFALLLGHEGDGLTDDALSRCDHQARIPMARGVDSLNVATAAAVALYELTRGGALNNRSERSGHPVVADVASTE